MSPSEQAVAAGELPLSQDEAEQAAGAILDIAGADGVEVVVAASRSGVTRFANSQIIQNTVRSELRAYVRIAVGQKLASATTNQLDAAHMQKAANQALEAARASREDPDFPGLPEAREFGSAPALMRYDAMTAAATPAQRADAVAAILRATEGTSAAGVFETSSHAYALLSSTGMKCYDAFTRGVMTCLADNGDATGWGEDSSHALADVDYEEGARRALDKAQEGRGAIDMDPGTYRVVLEPPAVAMLIDYLSYAGFGAKQVLEGESFLEALAGHQVADPAVTIADDVGYPGSVGIGFDFEGVPRRRVAVIDKGVATGPVSDTRTARKLGGATTGHFSGSDEFGPYAGNVVLEAGDRSDEELLEGVDDGLLVTRFHYVNVLDRPETLLTGMTRDGTFRIREGERAEPVHNFRFTQSVLKTLASVEGIGRDLRAFAPEFGSFGSTVAPSLAVGEFRFTSRTSH
ncbi:MAG: TldD/PmbA family protein [Actinomycetota bacterium]|nr:TldD/PmbA family protein [Actinomycetota bacterium]